MFDVANWVACLNGEDGPGETPSHGVLQFHLKEHWRYPQSLDILLPWSETISVSKSLQTPETKVGDSLRASIYKWSVVRQGKKATHKCSRIEGGISGPEKVQTDLSKCALLSIMRPFFLEVG